MALSWFRYAVHAAAGRLLHSVSGGAVANGSHPWLVGLSGLVGPDLCSRRVRLAFTTLLFRNHYIGDPRRAGRRPPASMVPVSSPSSGASSLPISGPIFGVCDLAIHPDLNDFRLRRIAGADSQPVTVALNNLVRTSTGVKPIQRRHGGQRSSLCGADAAGLHHRRQVFCARADRRAQ